MHHTKQMQPLLVTPSWHIVEHDFHCGTYIVVTWQPLLSLHCGDMTSNQVTIMVPTLWWHDYLTDWMTAGTLLPLQTWLLLWYLHCDDMVTKLWWYDYHHRLWGHDYHCDIYTVVAWQPLWYLHCRELISMLVPTLWWFNYHHCTYTMVTWLPSWYLHRVTRLPLWYLHCDDLTTIVVPTLWWHDF